MRAFGAALLLWSVGCNSTAGPPAGEKTGLSVEVTPEEVRVGVGERARLSALVRDSSSTVPEQRGISWESSDASLATVDGAGNVLGIAPGRVSIVARVESASDSSVVTVTPPPPLGDPFRPDQRPYTADSPWNTPIPADASIDPQSEAMIAGIARSNNGRLRSDPTQYSYPIYFADATTPRRSMVCSGIVSINHADGTRTSEADRRLAGVPIPAEATPSPGGDAQIIVIDTETGDEYDVYQFAPPDRCTNITRYVGGVYRAGVESSYVSRGAGVPYLAGLIRPWEIARGRIDHALAFGYDLSRDERCVWPASKTDGDDARTDAIPEGARLRLAPAVDVDRIEGLDAVGRIIARALQEYGMILIDNSGANKIYAEDELTAKWGGRLVAATVSAIPVERLQVLRLPDAYWAPSYQPTHGDCVR